MPPHVLFSLANTDVVHSDEFKKLGINDVYCLSVNDAFVMRQVRPIMCFSSHAMLNPQLTLSMFATATSVSP